MERIGADIQRGDYIDPAERRRHFRDWSAIWWNTTVKLRPSTRRGYWRLLENHVLPYFGHQTMGVIDYLEVEQFIATKLRKGLSPKKVRDAVSVVSLVMKCAVRANARKDNPAAGHAIRVTRRRVRPGDVPDMAEMERLVAHVKDPYKTGSMAVGIHRHPSGGAVRITGTEHRFRSTHGLRDGEADARQPL